MTADTIHITATEPGERATEQAASVSAGHSAPPLSPGQPAVDLAHLARMTLGEKGLEREVLDLFERQADMLLARMAAEEPRMLARSPIRWRALQVVSAPGGWPRWPLRSSARPRCRERAHSSAWSIISPRRSRRCMPPSGTCSTPTDAKSCPPRAAKSIARSGVFRRKPL